MIEGYISKDEFIYNTNLFKIDNKKYVLIIDGHVSNKYYHEIIKNYEKDNLKFINNIIDFISIFLFDKKKRKLVIINDRIGSKKVYYYAINNKLYFSNSLNELIRFSKTKNSINIDSLSMYFRFHYIPEPSTIYKDIYKLEHGHYLVYNNEKMDNKCYWDLIKLFNNREIEKKYNIVEEQLCRILKEQIKKLTRDKDNIGVYLSSGIDSSLLSSLYKDIANNIDTFTIGFESKRFNEVDSSKKIANYLNTNHHELIINNDDALEVIKKIYQYYEEPFGDSSSASTIILNEFAKKNNIKNAITGDGADQLFCGVLVYDLYYKINKYGKIANPFHLHLSDKFIKNSKLYYIFPNIPKKYRNQIDFAIYEKKIDGLFSDKGQKRFDYDIKTKNVQEERMILDLDTFMAQRVLPKMCIAAKKNNINIISPYLSHKVIEYTFKIPHKYKYHKRTKKYILKKMLYKRIPNSLFSDKKKGFGIPVKEWLKTTLNDDLKRVSQKDVLEKQNIFNYSKIKYLIENIDDNTNLVWDYYMFQLWYEQNEKNISSI